MARQALASPVGLVIPSVLSLCSVGAWRRQEVDRTALCPLGRDNITRICLAKTGQEQGEREASRSSMVR
jgi:hypothetical protein